MQCLNIASRLYYINVKNKPRNTGPKSCKYDSAVFTWHIHNKYSSILCTYIDDFLFGGNEFFINNVNKPLKSTFIIES